jgi:hypothetical protein
MAQVTGVVISISLETDVKKNGGGSYKGWELVYKSSDGEVRTIAKPVTGLQYNAPLKKQLGELSQGDEFTLTQEKNAAGFYDVKSIEKGIVEGGKAQASVGSTNQARAPQAVSNYETREERTARQRLIVRQSSLTAAIGILGNKATPPVVKDLAEDLTNWVFEKGQVGIANMEDDIPA